MFVAVMCMAGVSACSHKGVVASAPAPSLAQQEQDVRKAITQFYTALNVVFTGDGKLMNELWSHADDITYMGPSGGFQIGWKQVGEEWDRQVAFKLGGKIEPTDLHVTVSNGLAVVSNYEKGANVDAKGKDISVSLRVTSMFRLEGGHWKMIGHHTDLIPSLGKK